MKRNYKDLWHLKLPYLNQKKVENKPPTKEIKPEVKTKLKIDYIIYNGELVYSTGNINGDIEVIYLQGTSYCLDKTKIPTNVTEFKNKSDAINYAISISK